MQWLQWSRGSGVALVACLLAGAAVLPAAAADVRTAPEAEASIGAAPPGQSARELLGVPPGPADDTPVALPEVSARHRMPPVAESNRFGGAGSDLLAFDYESLPGRLGDPALRGLWEQGVAAELDDRLLDSARVYELIAGRVPEESFTYWRIARNYWRAGESLPVEDAAGRIALFESAESWAGRGISIDPDCAPCMLWKFVAIGRQATTRGVMSAVRDAREMDQLLTRGIQLQPTHSDGEGNSTLGNLYYAGAVFYRVVPDWWWLRLFMGVRGDKDKSLTYARRAVEISEARVDYRVELGAVLLCLGTARSDPARLAEGRAVLEQARSLEDFLGTDSVDKEHASVLMASPELACGYSRDGFIDVESLRDEARARR